MSQVGQVFIILKADLLKQILYFQDFSATNYTFTITFPHPFLTSKQFLWISTSICIYLYSQIYVDGRVGWDWLSKDVGSLIAPLVLINKTSWLLRDVQ